MDTYMRLVIYAIVSIRIKFLSSNKQNSIYNGYSLFQKELFLSMDSYDYYNNCKYNIIIVIPYMIIKLRLYQ